MVKGSPPGAIVLCGGRSTRMGRDKATLPFGDETLLDRVLRLVGTVTATIVLAAAPGQAVPAGVMVTRDPAEGEGPLPGLLRALQVMPTEYVFVVACDTPLLQPPLIAWLANLCEGWDGAVPLVRNQRVATCAIYRTASLRAAAAAFGESRHRSLKAFLGGLRIRDIPEATLQSVDPRLLSFTPCNTPEEYRQALILAGVAVNNAPPPAV